MTASNANQPAPDAEIQDDAGASIVALVPGPRDDARKVREGWRTDFPIHADPAKQAYGAYGLIAGDEPRPGTFVIATDGTVRYAHRGAAASDYPPIGQILPHVSALTGIVVEPPPMPERGAAPASMAFAASPMAAGGYAGPPPACLKCGGVQFSTADISTAGGWLSRMFNFQHRRFTAVTCERCGYTELYKSGSSALANVADILAGG